MVEWGPKARFVCCNARVQRIYLRLYPSQHALVFLFSFFLSFFFFGTGTTTAGRAIPVDIICVPIEICDKKSGTAAWGLSKWATVTTLQQVNMLDVRTTMKK